MWLQITNQETVTKTHAEWMLNPSIFQKATKHLKFEPDLDYFASRLYKKLCKYISYKPDPYAYLIDAFSVYWGFYNCYLFPPFSLIRRTLQKIRMDQIKVVLPVSKWSTQPWYNSFRGNVIPGTLCADPRHRKSTSTTKTRYISK